MTSEEVNKLNITNEDGVFTPQTEVTVIKNVDGNKTFNYKIIKSAEEVYQEFLENKKNVVVVTTLENYLLDLDYRLSLKELGV